MMERSDDYLFYGYEWRALEELCLDNGLHFLHGFGGGTSSYITRIFNNNDVEIFAWDWAGTQPTVYGLRRLMSRLVSKLGLEG